MVPLAKCRSDKLIERIKKDVDINDKLEFAKVESIACIEIWIIYRTELSKSDIVASTYNLASKDRLRDTARYLRDIIINAHKKSTSPPWPPTATDMDTLIAAGLPDEIQRFLELVLTNQRYHKSNND